MHKSLIVFVCSRFWIKRQHPTSTSSCTHEENILLFISLPIPSCCEWFCYLFMWKSTYFLILLLLCELIIVFRCWFWTSDNKIQFKCIYQDVSAIRQPEEHSVLPKISLFCRFPFVVSCFDCFLPFAAHDLDERLHGGDQVEGRRDGRPLVKVRDPKFA